jgi:peptidoglycan glycosyltransferase
LGCQAIPQTTTLAAAYTAACPAAFAGLGKDLGSGRLDDAFERWGLTGAPPLEIPTESGTWVATSLTTTAALRREAIGQGNLTVTPLQMVLVAATLANEGTMPAAHLGVRISQPDGSWLAAPNSGTQRPILAPAQAEALLEAWEMQGIAAVHSGTALAGEDKPHAWCLGAAPAGSPRYAIAVLIEHAGDAKQATQVCTQLLAQAAE